MWACYGGHIPIIFSLIEAGCDFSLRDSEGKSGMDILRERHPSKVDSVRQFQRKVGSDIAGYSVITTRHG